MTGFASVWILENYILLIHADRYPRNMTHISKKMSDHGKKQKRKFSQIGIQQVYVKNSGMWVGITVLVYKHYVKGTKMTKIENSGIQTGICRNLVYERHMNKISHLKWYTNLFLLL